ncbi:MAG: hypothetical protein WCH59_09385 [Chitinophagia bacterium]|jgi:hypothetical protein
MKTIIALLFLPFGLCAQDTTSYKHGKPLLEQQLADLSDSLKNAGSPWHIATIEELKKIQEKSVGKVANRQMGFVGVFWVAPVTRNKYGSIEANYCFISNNIFKVFYSSGNSASVLLFK